mmetsp:Transcript_1262/g.2775  ORF Transcript_1262/g.2775 Transcript_1262/m.2775 type:complete len:87 (-) Transcript_1262:33-293(-)
MYVTSKRVLKLKRREVGDQGTSRGATHRRKLDGGVKLTDRVESMRGVGVASTPRRRGIVDFALYFLPSPLRNQVPIRTHDDLKGIQ